DRLGRAQSIAMADPPARGRSSVPEHQEPHPAPELVGNGEECLRGFGKWPLQLASTPTCEGTHSIGPAQVGVTMEAVPHALGHPWAGGGAIRRAVFRAG